MDGVDLGMVGELEKIIMRTEKREINELNGPFSSIFQFAMLVYQRAHV